jgi:replicative DNA helicase
VSADAEKSVLGAILLDPTVLPEVMEVIRPADVARPLGEDIFRALLEMFTDAKPIDTITVAEKMNGHQGLANNGGPVFLFDLMHNTPSSSNALHYAEIVA